MKIGFIGGGWRTHGYLRVIEGLRHRMEVSGILAHSERSAERLEKEYPGRVETELEAFLRREHDFVMVLVPRESALYYVEELAKRGVPVLCETPPGDGFEELERCYDIRERYGAKIQVAEQYFLRPYYQAIFRLIESGRLGEISSMEIGMIHDYHALSIVRRVLGVLYEPCAVRARAFDFPVHDHCGRDGLKAEAPEHLAPNPRKRADFLFESGKAAFYDFSDQQYFNYFRTRHINIRGSLGEVCDYDVCWLGEDRLPVRGKIVRDQLGEYENLEGVGLRGLTLNGEVLYRNPYLEEDTRFSDDEIAMAGILDGMYRFVTGGEEIYSLSEALQDTALYLTMDQSILEDREITLPRKKWAK